VASIVGLNSINFDIISLLLLSADPLAQMRIGHVSS